jgi:hypothetical protein
MNATATTATNTATNTPVVNTRPCNGYAEFCPITVRSCARTTSLPTRRWM